MKTAEVPLRGLHNLENTMAAAAIAGLAGAAHAQIRSAVMTFPGVEHRLEFVRELGGVAWYNDSKATNVDATLKAIAAFEHGLWVILGGKDKNSDYSALGAATLAAQASGAPDPRGHRSQSWSRTEPVRATTERWAAATARHDHALSLARGVYARAHATAPGNVLAQDPANLDDLPG